MTVQVWNGTMFIVDTGPNDTNVVTQKSTREYLLKENNLADIPNRNIARQNLGISVSATTPIAPKINDIWIDLDS